MPQDGDTALIDAAGGRHRETVELLLERGADVEAKDRVSSARTMSLRWWTERACSERVVDYDGDQGCINAC